MARELLQARFDPDTVEAVEDLAEEKDISRSEAMRRALRDGLSAQQEQPSENDSSGGMIRGALYQRIDPINVLNTALLALLVALNLPGV